MAKTGLLTMSCKIDALAILSFRGDDLVALKRREARDALEHHIMKNCRDGREYDYLRHESTEENPEGVLLKHQVFVMLRNADDAEVGEYVVEDAIPFNDAEVALKGRIFRKGRKHWQGRGYWERIA